MLRFLLINRLTAACSTEGETNMLHIGSICEYQLYARHRNMVLREKETHVSLHGRGNDGFRDEFPLSYLLWIPYR